MASLSSYEQKRKASKTTEPRGRAPNKSVSMSKRSFCVQEHDAKRAGLHHDFRFEDEGVAKSFVFPKLFQFLDGRPRLAVQSEDHPLEYMEWEGVIEEGYGAGTVRLVCNGMLEVLSQDKSRFRLRISSGEFAGTYTFVRKDRKNWLVFKKRKDG